MFDKKIYLPDKRYGELTAKAGVVNVKQIRRYGNEPLALSFVSNDAFIFQTFSVYGVNNIGYKVKLYDLAGLTLSKEHNIYLPLAYFDFYEIHYQSTVSSYTIYYNVLFTNFDNILANKTSALIDFENVPFSPSASQSYYSYAPLGAKFLNVALTFDQSTTVSKTINVYSVSQEYLDDASPVYVNRLLDSITSTDAHIGLDFIALGPAMYDINDRRNIVEVINNDGANGFDLGNIYYSYYF